MFGTVESPCGPGDASGSTDQGVTDTEITVTSVSDSGGKIGGLNKGVDDSSKAFVEWCNAQGGINGREINLKMRNAELFNYGSVVTEACADSFAMVGGLAVFDDAGAQIQVDCGLPNVPLSAVSPQQALADLTWPALPQPPSEMLVGMARKLQSENPEATQRAGMMHGDVASIEYVADRMVQALEQLGFTFVWDATAPIGEPNWPPYVADMRSKGVEYFTAMSSWEEIVNLQNAMASQEVMPEVTALDSNLYQEHYPKAAGDVAEGVNVQINIWPFSEGDDNPAMKTYLEELEKAVPGAKPETLGVMSWSAWLMWATAVQALGSDVTRDGLGQQLDQVTSWSGGGIHGTTDPAGNHLTDCFIQMQIQDGEFKRIYPTKDADAEVYEAGNGFACDPANLAKLQTAFDDAGAKASN